MSLLVGEGGGGPVHAGERKQISTDGGPHCSGVITQGALRESGPRLNHQQVY